VSEIGLVRAGKTANPRQTGRLLAQSAQALLEGGLAPSVEGDDDETVLPAATSPLLRAQLIQQQRLVSDLTRTGNALLDGRPVPTRLTAKEHLRVTDRSSACACSPRSPPTSPSTPPGRSRAAPTRTSAT
jgi:hypothetical protein